MLIDCPVPLLLSEIAQEIVIWPNMTFDRLTIQLSKNEEQLEN